MPVPRAALRADREERLSIEVNATLFSAADKGCADLAKRLLDAGASLEARDRLGSTPLGRAAAVR